MGEKKGFLIILLWEINWTFEFSFLLGFLLVTQILDWFPKVGHTLLTDIKEVLFYHPNFLFTRQRIGDFLVKGPIGFHIIGWLIGFLRLTQFGFLEGRLFGA